MRRRVVSFCAALLFITYSIICGPTYASDIWTVDGNVDPWSDLEDMPLGGGGPADQQAVSASVESEPEDLSGFDGFGFVAEGEDGDTYSDVVYFDGTAPMSEALNKFRVTCLSNGTVSVKDGSYAAKSFDMSTLVRESLPVVIPSSIGENPSGSSILVTEYSSPSKTFLASSSSSSYTFYLEFTQLTGASVKELSLSGSLGCSLAVRTSNGRNSKDFPATSCQLIYYVEDKDTPVIVASFPVNSLGNVSFDASSLSINSKVVTAGLRFIVSDISSPVINTGLGSSRVDVAWCFGIGKPNGNFDSILSDGQITNGLLGGLIELVTGIFNAVVSLPSKIGEIITSITELPGKLWQLISDGLKSLFIPTEEQLQQLGNKYNSLFEDKLGFIYQMFSYVVDAFKQIANTLQSGQTYSFEFPGIQFPMNGDMVVLLPKMTVSLDNAVMDVLRPVLGTGVSLISVLALISTAFDMVVAILSGASYFEFIGQKREELDV